MAIGAGVATVAGAAISSNGAKSAANTIAQGQQGATQAQYDMYNQTRADQAPWRGAGGQAVNALSQWYGLGGVNQDGTTGTAQTPDYNAMLQNMPGYQFQMDQGNQAVQHNLAARGLLQSGAAGKALTQYGQGQAASYADKYVNGLQSLAGVGQSSVQATGSAGANAANGAGNAIQNGAAGVASGQVGQANAWANGLAGLGGLYGQYQSQQAMQQNQLQPFGTMGTNAYQLQDFTPTAQRYGMN
jgi:hypothetical protein